MKFNICYKYSLKSIFIKKSFLIVNICFILVLLVLNLAWGISNVMVVKNENSAWILNIVNSVFIFSFCGSLATLQLHEFLNVQKHNGIRTIEAKNGLKSWQIFFAKHLAVITSNLVSCFVFATFVIIISAIVNYSNPYYVKMISINLYATILLLLVFISFVCLLTSIIFFKISLIISGSIIVILSFYPMFSSILINLNYEEVQNDMTGNQFSFGSELYFHTLAKEIDQAMGNSELIKELRTYTNNCLRKSVIRIENSETLDSEIEETYNSIRERLDNSMISSGKLVEIVDELNELSENYLKDAKNHKFLLKIVKIESLNCFWNQQILKKLI
ncbi:hypothetical protein [Spiroplasma clarkii]|uniref:hypothetical protein n=1 Tax=Spiroplasma clarkii TaxID=2139 RepID=UPI0011BAB197|nr:hypothetical protein [Spiroplasma clarkii]